MLAELAPPYCYCLPRTSSQPSGCACAFCWLAGVAKVCCEGRVVSVLEGGYGTQVHDHKTKKWTFNRDQFANNVAAHVKALMAG